MQVEMTNMEGIANAIANNAGAAPEKCLHSPPKVSFTIKTQGTPGLTFLRKPRLHYTRSEQTFACKGDFFKGVFCWF